MRRDFQDYVTSRAATGSDVDGAVLILSELFTNVVQHAPGPLHAWLEWIDGKGVLHVRDWGQSFEGTRSDSIATSQESGRGLHIVASLATRVEKADAPSGFGNHVIAWLPITQDTARIGS
ncbi:MAG TPA: ATP-binding protein [Candidatus Baltobacteraceae bacterium]